MRARHRHFNPKDAGAVAAYDARFITGLSDGDGVATWSSRTGTNDATQSTALNQPKYETNEINGNPVVNFDFINDFLTISISVPSSATVVAVHRRSTTGLRTINFLGVSRYPLYWDTDNIIYTQWGGGFHTFSPAQTNTGSLVITSTKNETTTSQVYLNGLTFRSAIVPDASSGTFTGIGGHSGSGARNNGAIGNLCLLNSFASDSLRRRLEHAAAFSFKIACS